VGTGPFQFVSYQKDAVIRYKAFDAYWGGRPKIDNLVFAITTDASVRFAKLKTGECHVMAFPKPADIALMKADPNITLVQQNGLNVGYIAACLRDDMDYKRSQFYLTTPVWEPVFEPDISSLSLIGDALIKMQQAYPNYFGELSIYDLTGIKPESVAEGMTMERIDEEANGGAIIDDLLNIGGV
jgi:hypothetical protein